MPEDHKVYNADSTKRYKNDTVRNWFENGQLESEWNYVQIEVNRWEGEYFMKYKIDYHLHRVVLSKHIWLQFVSNLLYKE